MRPLAVDIHFGIGHHAVEIHINLLSGLILRHEEILAVMSYAFVRETSRVSGKIHSERPFYGKIVRNRHTAPASGLCWRLRL